jgi:hypothetical protein
VLSVYTNSENAFIANEKIRGMALRNERQATRTL